MNRLKGLANAKENFRVARQYWLYVRKKNALGLSVGYAYRVADWTQNTVYLFPPNGVGDYMSVKNFVGESNDEFTKVGFM